jgi:hypothetical protein
VSRRASSVVDWNVGRKTIDLRWALRASVFRSCGICIAAGAVAAGADMAAGGGRDRSLAFCKSAIDIMSMGGAPDCFVAGAFTTAALCDDS